MDFAPQKPKSRVAAAAFVLIAAAMVITIAVLAPAPALADKLSDKRAEADRVKTKLDRLTHQLDDLNERVQYETLRLDTANEKLARAQTELKAAQASFQIAQVTLINRLVVVYMSGNAQADVLQVARSGSFSNFVDKLDTIQNVSESDASLVDELKAAQRRIVLRKAQFKIAQRQQTKLTGLVQHSRDKMASKTSEQQQILNSVEADVRALVIQKQAEERARDLARAQAQAQVSANAKSNTNDAGSVFDTPNLTPATGSGSGSDAASVALRYLGVPYVWGGSTPSGFDCSGLVMYAYAQVGVSLPHSSYALWNAGTRVSLGELQRGDLVFFSGLGHVGIYLGGGSFVHAPHSGTVVQISSMSGWYSSNFEGGVRI